MDLVVAFLLILPITLLHSVELYVGWRDPLWTPLVSHRTRCLNR